MTARASGASLHSAPAIEGGASNRAFVAGSALLFAASASTTVLWCGSMSAMGGMAMPGGWDMSMAWMRMSGQTWTGAAASFVGMWAVMMVAMMLPSLMPMLSRYRRAIGASAGARLDALTVRVATGYFLVWTALGALIFPLGVALADAEMRSPALSQLVPIAAGAIVLIAGALQLTSWKARRLACCREEPAFETARRADGGTAWSHGLRLGLRCVACCAEPTAVLLVAGVMDLRAMAVVAAAISAERLAPAGARVAKGIGVATSVAGLLLIANALAGAG